MKDPLFSIVIPTYNRAKLIRKTIESVLDQRMDDFEVIVIDDGSTDDTGSVVSAISDPRVRYLKKENEERAVARNIGAQLARGRYVTFLDSDDIVYPEHLTVAGKMVDSYSSPEWFHLGYEFVDSAGKTLNRVDGMPEIANDRLISGNHLSCDGVFIRRDVALSLPFIRDRALSGTEDYELWLRLASRFPLYCDNRVTSAIVQHDDRSVVNTSRRKLVDRITLLESSVLSDSEFIEKFGQRIGEFKANNRLYISLHLALSKQDRVGATIYLVKALFASPRALKNRAFYGTIKRLVV